MRDKLSFSGGGIGKGEMKGGELEERRNTEGKEREKRERETVARRGREREKEKASQGACKKNRTNRTRQITVATREKEIKRREQSSISQFNFPGVNVKYQSAAIYNLFPALCPC